MPEPLEPLETRSEREVAPQSVGLDAGQVDRIWQATRRLFRTRTQPAMALAIRRRGQVVLERSIGHARPGVLVTPRTPFCTFSVSKSVTAVVMHMLDERDRLRLDDPVCEYLPEFARHGKEWVTIRHVLTHRAGIPSVTGDGGTLEALTDPDRIVAMLCDTKPVFLPGRRLAYHAVTGGFILGEIVKRVTGRGIDRFLVEEIAEPLGFEHLTYGVAPERIGEVAENRFTGLPVPFPFSRVIKRALGLSLPEAVAASNDPRWLTGVVPSGNVMATADDLARFFELLLRGGEFDGQRILAPRTVRRLLVESAYLEPDLTLGLAVRYGQGVMLGALPISLFGPDTSRAFGHYGLVNIVAYADPDRDISVGLLTSGKAVIANQLPAFFGLLRAIAESIPLA
ncbi:MAG: serine hydrolase domain-containing protein [Myxococcota bacterium]